jgi:hypothetical protein
MKTVEELEEESNRAWKVYEEMKKTKDLPLRKENEEMREILIELAGTTHTSKRLHDWYCKRGIGNENR